MLALVAFVLSAGGLGAQAPTPGPTPEPFSTANVAIPPGFRFTDRLTCKTVDKRTGAYTRTFSGWSIEGEELNSGAQRGYCTPLAEGHR